MWRHGYCRLIRHSFCGALILFTCGVHAAQSPSAEFAQIQARAKALAAQPYHSVKQALPPFLANLNYDQYRDLRFKPENSWWLKPALPFQVQFFSRGFTFTDRVLVNVIEEGTATPLEFRPSLFDFGRLPVPKQVPGDLGFAGLRLHYPLNRRDYYDELLVFLGASYFRAVGRDEVYGLSARGLAVDTGVESGEEFPVFREFWLVQPAPGAEQMTLYALLDSPSVAGAYQFVVRPGRMTDIEVSAQLYFRNDVEKVGLAPLTSMFYFGESTNRAAGDFRPEVHDSDGLLIASGKGERLWRPLSNPQSLQISSFAMENPKGFGLLQRDRDFNDYQDLEADYHRRPSAWVEPQGEWGKGAIELVEIPEESETHDNIVAFWVADTAVKAGAEISFAYNISFGDDPERGLDGGRAIATRIGTSQVIGSDVKADPESRKFVIDFAGNDLADLPAGARVKAQLSATAGTLGQPIVQANPHTKGYRVIFNFTPNESNVIDLRCSLRVGEDFLSETWTYQWRRPNPAQR